MQATASVGRCGTNGHVAWDGGRPVPWRRIVTLFAVYALVANAALLLFARETYGIGTVAGMGAGFVIYLGAAWVMVKLGWNPPSMRPRQAAAESAERRAARAATTSTPAAKASDPSGPRPKPAPTRRTNATNRRARR